MTSVARGQPWVGRGEAPVACSREVDAVGGEQLLPATERLPVAPAKRPAQVAEHGHLFTVHLSTVHLSTVHLSTVHHLRVTEHGLAVRRCSSQGGVALVRLGGPPPGAAEVRGLSFRRRVTPSRRTLCPSQAISARMTSSLRSPWPPYMSSPPHQMMIVPRR